MTLFFEAEATEFGFLEVWRGCGSRTSRTCRRLRDSCTTWRNGPRRVQSAHRRLGDGFVSGNGPGGRRSGDGDRPAAARGSDLRSRQPVHVPGFGKRCGDAGIALSRGPVGDCHDPFALSRRDPANLIGFLAAPIGALPPQHAPQCRRFVSGHLGDWIGSGPVGPERAATGLAGLNLRPPGAASAGIVETVRTEGGDRLALRGHSGLAKCGRPGTNRSPTTGDRLRRVQAAAHANSAGSRSRQEPSGTPRSGGLRTSLALKLMAGPYPVRSRGPFRNSTSAWVSCRDIKPHLRTLRHEHASLPCAPACAEWTSRPVRPVGADGVSARAPHVGELQRGSRATETSRRDVDGGVWSNNPTMVALTEALSCFDASLDRAPPWVPVKTHRRPGGAGCILPTE